MLYTLDQVSLVDGVPFFSGNVLVAPAYSKIMGIHKKQKFTKDIYVLKDGKFLVGKIAKKSINTYQVEKAKYQCIFQDDITLPYFNFQNEHGVFTFDAINKTFGISTEYEIVEPS